MRFLHYLRTAKNIIKEFDFQTPLPLFLKNYYRRDRRMGSTDRRTVGSLVYSYFRTGNLLGRLSLDERLQAAWFLCHREKTVLLEYFHPEWNREAAKEPLEKLAVLENKYGPLDGALEIFPFHEHLSKGIDPLEYALSMLHQPDLFIRVREDAMQKIKNRLTEAGINFRELSATCLAFDNSTRLTEVLKDFKGLFEIQDQSSQLTGGYFQPLKGEDWWDACAGSGGKALMLHSLEPSVRLYVSDNRPSILQNLERRFREAGIRGHKTLQADLRLKNAWEKQQRFDGILLDSPCSGSGTWGRSPEMMAAFREPQLQKYSELQKTIAGNIIPFLKPGKPLIYITCSVFREENEEVAAFICEQFGMHIETQVLLKGYEYKADTMFVARFLKK